MTKCYAKRKLKKNGKPYQRNIDYIITSKKPHAPNGFVWVELSSNEIPKKLQKKYTIPYNPNMKNSFRWDLKINYNTMRTSRNCVEYGCDGICRCETIDFVELDELNILHDIYTAFRINFLRKTNQYTLNKNNISNSINQQVIKYFPYFIDRIIRLQNLSKNHFEILVSKGYYGEEIDEIVMQESIFKNITTDLIKIIYSNNLYDAICTSLQQEYAFISDVVASRSRISIHMLNVNNIRATMTKLSNVYDPILLATEPQGVVYQIGNHYHLIDGHHRLKYYSDQNKICMFVLN